MTAQLFGFSPESFEQFARALAISVFGPGVTSFGNGPDGGREATFRGEVPYPYPPTTQWNGYGVIQAKCKEKPESAEKDQTWALAQLRSELRKFASSSKRTPKPDYYVFVTNVELSSAASGGRDVAEAIVQSYHTALPLKGYAIWDANQIAAYLTKFEELRRRFVAHLTSGDVLAAMLADIERRRPKITRILTGFLERELRAEEVSRLDQAGNRTEEQLRLAQLFFDLPASAERRLIPPNEGISSDGALPPGVLWELLRDGSRNLDPKILYEQEMSSGEGIQFPARYVLLGGPGCGKSTVCQFLAQIHRAALLGRREQYLLDSQTRTIVRETRELCEREGLPWPTTPRYPFRVELNRFAKLLASNESDRVESLARYLLNSIRHEHYVTHEDLIEWLGMYPWLLILDGLDEVPATSNRNELVRTVNEFLAEARLAEADLFVVATSRQQGYAGEFASGIVAMRHILPLSTARAMKYVEQYANARFGLTDPTRARDMVDKLRDSAKRDLTAQLMATPLQVAFMATVVAARGDPGEDRWQLFDSYYRTIYDRERQKAVPPYDRVLVKHQPTIDRLHYDIGFYLQCQGEMAGGTDVNLPIAYFDRLVSDYIDEIGYEGVEKLTLVNLITEAARQRLVFLTSRIPGELSFDVRSIQEYMAAECIMTGSPNLVKSRLRAIAPVPYWRNVFLFAASKCFVDTRARHFQDEVRLICEDVNDSNDPLLEATRAGSELAIDVLQSGAVAQNPNHARHLARIGFALLSQPYLVEEWEEGATADQRLALGYSRLLEGVYRSELELRVGQTDVARALGAWPLLIRLVEMGVEWATDVAERFWPKELQAQFNIVAHVLPDLPDVRWLRAKAEDVILRTSPMDAIDILMSYDEPGDPSTLIGAIKELFRQDVNVQEFRLLASGQDTGGISLRIDPVFNGLNRNFHCYATMERFSFGHPGWMPFVLSRSFLETPNSATLAKVLRDCADGGWTPLPEDVLRCLPWPLAGCLTTARSTEDLNVLAEQVEKGEFGDEVRWQESETRWRNNGVSIDEISRRVDREIPPGDAIDGMPRLVARGWSVAHRMYPSSVYDAFFRSVQRMRPGGEHQLLLQLMCSASLSSGAMVNCVDPSQLRTAVEQSTGGAWWSMCYVGIPDESTLMSAWIEFFEWLGRSSFLSAEYYRGFGVGENEDAWNSVFCQEYIRDRAARSLSAVSDRAHDGMRVGLLRLLGRTATGGAVCDAVPPVMLDLESFESPRFKLAALLVRLSQTSFTERDAADLADKAIGLLHPPAEPAADYMIFTAVQAHLMRAPGMERFILCLRRLMPASVELGVAHCEQMLRAMLRGRASGLRHESQLRSLCLPVVDPVR